MVAAESGGRTGAQQVARFEPDVARQVGNLLGDAEQHVARSPFLHRRAVQAKPGAQRSSIRNVPRRGQPGANRQPARAALGLQPVGAHNRRSAPKMPPAKGIAVDNAKAGHMPEGPLGLTTYPPYPKTDPISTSQSSVEVPALIARSANGSATVDVGFT